MIKAENRGTNMGSCMGGEKGQHKLVKLNEKIIEQGKRVQAFVETSYLNADMCTFELSQSEEIRALPADSSKAYNNPRAFNCSGSVENLLLCEVRIKNEST